MWGGGGDKVCAVVGGIRCVGWWGGVTVCVWGGGGCKRYETSRRKET